MKYKGLVKLIDNIKKLMVEKNMAQKELSIRTGVSHVTISCYMNYHSSPKLETIAAIAIALGVDVRELFAGIETEDMI